MNVTRERYLRLQFDAVIDHGQIYLKIIQSNCRLNANDIQMNYTCCMYVFQRVLLNNSINLWGEHMNYPIVKLTMRIHVVGKKYDATQYAMPNPAINS